MTAATLRRLPVPVSEPYPPVELHRRPPVPVGQAELSLVFSAATAPVEPEERWAAPQPTGSARLPDPDATAGALVQAVVEVLAGTRQASQLVRWVSGDVYTALQRRAALAARLRYGQPVGSGAARRAVVRSVRTSSPADGVVEACAVVLDRGRVRAVAVRLEGLDGRWRATALEVG